MKQSTFVFAGFCVLCALFFCGKVYAKVVLTSIWGDNMVLQQQSAVTFRGTAKKNTRLSIVPSWNHHKVQVRTNERGYWEATLSTPTAGGPYTICFSDGERLTLKNILIGEVWFCSGQSNMEMPVRGFRGQPVYGSHPYIVSASSRRPLRLYTVQRAWSTTPKTEGVNGQWQELSPKAVGDFSATAYFFGDLLQRSVDVPVGLIHCSWSASKIEAWMSRETLGQFTEVTLPDVGQTAFGWPAGTPTLLWNAMVSPWKGFPVRGVIWYQGEANINEPQLYKKMFPAMVGQWRAFFENPQMPVYYAQIAPYRSGGNDKLNGAWFRQCQLELMSEVPHVGMAVTADAGSELFIHPPHKIAVGHRLAYWALAKTYGREGFLYSGPIYQSCVAKDSVVEVTFLHGHEGLIPEKQLLKGFEVVDEQGKVYPAHAQIIESSARVKVWSDSVARPKEVRYRFRNYMEGNLYNNAHLPASPFRAVVR